MSPTVRETAVARRAFAPKLWWIVLGAGVLVVAAATTLFVLFDGQPKDRKPKGPTPKQVKALALKYPAASETLPASITVEYDKAKDRTRMTLKFSNLTATGAAPQYAPSSVEFQLISEFTGTVRPSDKGESSVGGHIVAHAHTQGLLAVAEPSGVITVGSASIYARPASKSKSGYKSEVDPAGGFHESLVFKIDTSDILVIAAGDSASAKFGALTFALAPAQMADLREFAARLNPSP